jgi:putative CocE/NonD family hydrolase
VLISRSKLVRGAICVALLAIVPATCAQASVVEHGYLPLPDGTKLAYTLTTPAAQGKWPVVLEYDPYAAGATSDPTWNASGYAWLGVNFRGTGCSQGVFNMTDAHIWGRDGADVVAWAAKQSWSDGKIGMTGFSFDGVSQIATAEYAGPALKAIMPFNIFPDLYRDISYPGGVLNSLDPAWIIAGRQVVVGGTALEQGAGEPQCDSNEATSTPRDDAQTFDTTDHPYRDSYWAQDPESMVSRVHVPILGCVDWQDMTAYSRAFDEFRSDYNPTTTWLVGGDGSHYDCGVTRQYEVRFLDHYLKGIDDGWQQEPHLLLIHEASADPQLTQTQASMGRWQTSFQTWAGVTRAITPLTLYFGSGGSLGLAPQGGGTASDSYVYDGATGANKPEVYNNVPVVSGTELTYTTPRLSHDAEFLGSGSANLWMSSTAPDTTLQVMISEIRPDGQESFVADGWLRLSQRKLDPAQSTVLRPVQTDLLSDVEPLTPGVPVLARLQIEPFDHVFRAGSAIRLSIDAPASSLVALPIPAVNTIEHTPGMESAVVLGYLPGARAEAGLPACAQLLNQPCRAVTGTVPTGSLDLPGGSAPARTSRAARATRGR